MISISDNASGILKENMGKTFQLFFTTRPTDQGAGLSLSSSYETTTRGNMRN